MQKRKKQKMKKLVIAAFAVAFAAIAQAASVNWNALSVSKSPATSGATSYAAYFMFGTQDQLNTLVAGLTDNTLAAATVSSIISGAASSVNGTYVAASELTNFMKTGATVSVTGSQSAFVVILDAQDSAAKNFIALDAKTVSIPEKTAGIYSWGNQSAATWTEIAPEPTSGLMMLLGMGVLALRRRRA